MDKRKHELLLIVEAAIIKLTTKRKKTDTEQAIYTDLILLREKLNQTNAREGFRMLGQVIRGLLGIARE